MLSHVSPGLLQWFPQIFISITSLIINITLCFSFFFFFILTDWMTSGWRSSAWPCYSPGFSFPLPSCWCAFSTFITSTSTSSSSLTSRPWWPKRRALSTGEAGPVLLSVKFSFFSYLIEKPLRRYINLHLHRWPSRCRVEPHLVDKLTRFSFIF